MTWRILEGDCRDVLRSLPARSVHTVVTSPPYYGLRDYGTGTWEGGDPMCDHATAVAHTEPPILVRRSCRCGAVQRDQQLGLEATPDAYVAALVAVFREVRRVLRDDGTVWLNLGDSYAGSWGAQSRGGTSQLADRSVSAQQILAHPRGQTRTGVVPPDADYKAKDLLGIPWMVAFALRADGWYLRSDIIWSKPNPMPESVTDRPTKAHEYVFLLSKGPRYYYDADAIREDNAESAIERRGLVLRPNGRDAAMVAESARTNGGEHDHGRHAPRAESAYGVGGRNKRTVWTIATQPYAGAHFATFPPKLIEPCVLAGSPERACGKCGAPWVRVIERTAMVVMPTTKREAWQAEDDHARTQTGGTMLEAPTSRTVGWEPSCSHGDGSARGVVLDPFCGAATTGLVAAQHGRDFIGIELSPKYAALGRERVETFVRLGYRTPQGARRDADDGQGTMFDLEGDAA